MLFFLTACSQKDSSTSNKGDRKFVSTHPLIGEWKVDLKLQDQSLPILFRIDDLDTKTKKLSGVLVNSSERIKLSGHIETSNNNSNHFYIELGPSYGVFEGELKLNKIEGVWKRTNKKDFSIPFKGMKSKKQLASSTSLYKEYESKMNLLDISGKWKVTIDDKNEALGIFKQKGSRVSGSIITSTGDYRFLDGYINKNEVKLYGFDGAFSFIIKMKVQNEKLSAMMYSGKSYSAIINGVRDENFRLDDPRLLTKMYQDKTISFSLKNLANETVILNKKTFPGKAKIIQIFGSWCPNCIDETSFFLKWRKDNQAKLNHLEFMIVAFENFTEKKDAIKALKKIKYKMQIDYPILIGDFKTTKTVTKLFPIEKIKAFPTTLFLDRNHKVINIHTGFSGQATGEFFEKYKEEFNKLVNEMIK